MTNTRRWAGYFGIVTEVVRCIVVLDEVQALVLILWSDPVPANLLDE